ncbi:hypothetical protein SUGI_0460630 [Cryptomeria japonica]|nr:hypothetical protein SUGI_0460630 [Cryptomeria japonica]
MAVWRRNDQSYRFRGYGGFVRKESHRPPQEKRADLKEASGELESIDLSQWIRLYNLPIKYWGEESLENIGRSLGKLLEIDEKIVEGDSYLYARMRVAAVKQIPSMIMLKSEDRSWRQQIEIEKPEQRSERCGSITHVQIDCRMFVRLTRKWAPRYTNDQRDKSGSLPQPEQNQSLSKVVVIAKLIGKGKYVIGISLVAGDKVQTKEHLGDSTMEINGSIPLLGSEEGEIEAGLGFEEDLEVEDELDILDPRCIIQSANALLGRAKDNRGKRRNK